MRSWTLLPKSSPLRSGCLGDGLQRVLQCSGTSSSPLSGTARARTDHILRSLSQHAAVTQPLGSAEAAKCSEVYESKMKGSCGMTLAREERTVPEASDFGGKKSVDAPNFRRFKDSEPRHDIVRAHFTKGAERDQHPQRCLAP
eukprot:3963485-Amphidinium_carterae.1